MFENEIKILIEKINAADSIAIIGHKNPDGDSLGSVLGLARLIQLNFDKDAECIYDGNLPDYLDFLPGRASMVHANNLEERPHYDLLVVLDLANPDKQFGDHRFKICGASEFIIKIDHHLDSVDFAAVDMTDSSANATAEILFDIAKSENWKIDEIAANLLLAGIVSDTADFRHARRGHVLRAAAELVDLGASMEFIMEGMDVAPKKHIVAQGKVIGEAEFYGDLALAIVRHEDYKRLDGAPNDVKSMLRKIKGIEFVVVLTEAKQDEVGVSMRSKSKPVNKIAAEFFNGGGHECAAGGRFYGNLEDARAAVKQAFGKK
jgi:phosphoesterase RecJ-like protein